jgi:predicted small secreted protein
MVKPILVSTLALAAGLSLAGCNTPQGQNAGAGAVLGGATGAVIGAAASGGRPGATIVGGVIGAATGAMIGSAATPPGPYYGPPYYGPYRRRCAEWVYDAEGRRYCDAFY